MEDFRPQLLFNEQPKWLTKAPLELPYGWYRAMVLSLIEEKPGAARRWAIEDMLCTQVFGERGTPRPMNWVHSLTRRGCWVIAQWARADNFSKSYAIYTGSSLHVLRDENSPLRQTG